MKYIREYSEYNDIDSFDIKLQFYGSRSYFSFCFAETEISVNLTEVKREVESLIQKYKETYKKNNEWGGGPVNREFCDYFSNLMSKKVDRYDMKVNKPTINLNIFTEVGKLVLGFSIISKKCMLINWSGFNYEGDSDYFKKLNKEMLSYANSIYKKGTHLDEVLKKNEINVDIPIEWEALE